MTASLGMYPFAHLRDAYDRLWSAIAVRLPGAPLMLAHDVDVHEVWHAPDLLIGQTCGWPLVTTLPGVAVVGGFDVAAPFAKAGRYRSVIIASKPVGIEQWRAEPATVCAVNGFGSLSGWVSLCDVWGDLPGSTIETGAHLESMKAVADGRAHIASIDSMSFEFIAESMPSLVGRVHVIGHGPMVPSLPLITAPAHVDRVPALRAAVATAVADPALAEVCRVLRIRGFVPFERSDYLPLLELAHPRLR